MLQERLRELAISPIEKEILAELGKKKQISSNLGFQNVRKIDF